VKHERVLCEERTLVEVRANEEEFRRVRTANAERTKQRSSAAAAAGNKVERHRHGAPSSLELIAEQLQKLEVD